MLDQLSDEPDWPFASFMVTDGWGQMHLDELVTCNFSVVDLAIRSYYHAI